MTAAKIKRIDPRPNISREIAATLRQMIADGRLAPGQRINEVRLALELGVSRTPLREALAALAAEGALEVTPRKGFFVTPLSLEELESIYPIRAILDPEALKLAGVPDARQIARLEALNRQLGKARTAEARIGLDDQWHLDLVAGCGNPVLLDLIRQFIRRTHRYEYGYLKEAGHLGMVVEEHDRILDALKKGDLEGACRRLRQNMTSGLGPLREWLKRKDRKSEDSR